MEFLRTYGFLLLAFLVSVTFIFLYFKFMAVTRFKTWQIIVISLGALVFGLLNAKLFAIMMAGFDLKKAGNMTVFGPLFTDIIYGFILYFIFKKNLPSLIDDIAILLIISFLIMRVNCLHAGCCLGKIYDVETGARYPTRIMEIGFNLIAIVLVRLAIVKNKFKGLLYPMYTFSYGVFRFISEFFRESSLDGANLWHAGHTRSLIAIAYSIVVFIGMYLYQKNVTEKEKA